MRKILYGTTALIAAGMISTAVSAAEPVKLQLGGFMDWYAAAMKQENSFRRAMSNAVAGDGDFNDFDIIGDGEIYFKGSTMLDNGMDVAVHVELEAGTGDEATRSIDESYVTIGTAYGQVIVGATRNAASKMHVSAPEVGRLGVDESRATLFVVAPAAVVGLNASWLNFDDRVNKIAYISPTLYNLTFGATWTPGNDAGNPNRAERSLAQTGNFKEGYAFNLKYADEFNGLGITSTAAYAAYNVGGKHARGEYSLGQRFAYNGFTLGGAYRKVHNHTDITGWNGAARAEGQVSDNGYTWNAGGSYEAGPYGVSLNYFKSQVEGDRRVTGVADDRDKKDKVEGYKLSGKYNLGAGVDSFATIAHVKYQDEITKTAANEDDHNKGWAFITGIALTF